MGIKAGAVVTWFWERVVADCDLTIDTVEIIPPLAAEAVRAPDTPNAGGAWQGALAPAGDGVRRSVLTPEAAILRRAVLIQPVVRAQSDLAALVATLRERPLDDTVVLAFTVTTDVIASVHAEHGSWGNSIDGFRDALGSMLQAELAVFQLEMEGQEETVRLAFVAHRISDQTLTDAGGKRAS